MLWAVKDASPTLQGPKSPPEIFAHARRLANCWWEITRNPPGKRYMDRWHDIWVKSMWSWKKSPGFPGKISCCFSCCFEVAHYEVRSKSLETKKWTRMLMRVILASEEPRSCFPPLKFVPSPFLIKKISTGEESGGVEGGFVFASKCSKPHRLGNSSGGLQLVAILRTQDA